MRPAVREALFLGFLILIALASYWPALDVFFSTDDALFLMRAEGLEDWGGGTRRLLSVRGFFTVCWRLFGENAAPFHLIMLVMHGLNAWLLGRVAHRLGMRGNTPVLAALFYLATPVAFTCLHWISGVQDVMMALFALLAALFWLRGTWASGLLALLFGAAAVLSKEPAVLLLPGMALVLPGDRRRRIFLGAASLAMGVVLLWTGGAFTPRSAADPYATVYGVNMLWNLLTYDAWLLRLWDVFPDRVPEFQPGLWTWGLLPPLLLGGLALWRRAWAPAIGKASLFFFLLLLPVLPLVRHSYLYYLYLPVAPLALLAAAACGRLPRRYAQAALLLPVLLLAVTLWRAEARRGATLANQLVADPMLRYGGILEDTVARLRSERPGLKGDVIVVTPFGRRKSVDLAKGLRSGPNTRRVQFLPVEKATYRGTVLPLFFPELESFVVMDDLPPEGEIDWEDAELFALTGLTEFNYLGRGEAGRYALSRQFFARKDFERARREIELLLSRQPNDPDRLYDLGAIALVQGDLDVLRKSWAALRELASAETSPGSATAALRALAASVTRAGIDPESLEN